MNRYRASRVITPIQPHSSLSTEKMKSVVCSGRKSRCAWLPCPQPLPLKPPEPIAILDWMMFQPVPSGSDSGFMKVRMRSRW